MLLGLAALGAVLTASSWRRLWLLYAVAATYAASVVLFNLRYTLASDGRIDEALPHFERALALNPNDENARRNLAQTREVLRRPR